MEKKWLLGKTADGERIYLVDFEWSCKWYWGGGYLRTYRRGAKKWSSHTHFDSTFGGEVDMHTGFNAIIKFPVLSDYEVWRLCDLMIQFYAYRKAAECAQYGGHMTSKGRTEDEIDQPLADLINSKIEHVIIKEIRALMEGTEGRKISMKEARK